MPDNLTISISADSSKLRSDLALAEASLRGLRKELKAAADEAQKTGDTAKLKEVSESYVKAEREVRRLGKAVRDTSGDMKDAGTAVSGLTSRFGEMNRTINGAAEGFRRLSTAFRGLAVVEGARVLADVLRSLGDIVGDVVKSLTELRNTALGVGLDPKDLAVIEEVFDDNQVSIDSARGALARFSDSLAAARKDAEKSVDVFGKLAPAFTNLTAEQEAASNAYVRLKIDVNKFSKDAEGSRKVLIAIGDALREMAQTDPAKATSLGIDVFGKKFAEIAPAIFAMGDAWKETFAQMAASGRLPTAEQFQAVKEYHDAWDRVGDAFDEMRRRFVFASGGMDASLVRGIARVVEFGNALDRNLFKGAERFSQGWQYAVDYVKELFSDENILQAFQKSVEQIQALWNDLWNGIIDKAKQVGSAIGGALGFSGGGATPAAQGMASGGQVRGPGSGTSDSIPAWLSNGEFVMRRAAVDRWGPRFMEQLNALSNPFGYAAGGPVRPLGPLAIAGKTAAGADGAPVHLHFPSGSQVQLHGDKAIVRSLLREARRAGMVSAGRPLVVA